MSVKNQFYHLRLRSLEKRCSRLENKLLAGHYVSIGKFRHLLDVARQLPHTLIGVVELWTRLWVDIGLHKECDDRGEAFSNAGKLFRDMLRLTGLVEYEESYRACRVLAQGMDDEEAREVLQKNNRHLY